MTPEEQRFCPKCGENSKVFKKMFFNDGTRIERMKCNKGHLFDVIPEFEVFALAERRKRDNGTI